MYGNAVGCPTAQHINALLDDSRSEGSHHYNNKNGAHAACEGDDGSDDDPTTIIALRLWGVRTLLMRLLVVPSSRV